MQNNKTMIVHTNPNFSKCNYNCIYCAGAHVHCVFFQLKREWSWEMFTIKRHHQVIAFIIQGARNKEGSKKSLPKYGL